MAPTGATRHTRDAAHALDTPHTHTYACMHAQPTEPLGNPTVSRQKPQAATGLLKSLRKAAVSRLITTDAPRTLVQCHGIATGTGGPARSSCIAWHRDRAPHGCHRLRRIHWGFHTKPRCRNGRPRIPLVAAGPRAKPQTHKVSHKAATDQLWPRAGLLRQKRYHDGTHRSLVQSCSAATEPLPASGFNDAHGRMQPMGGQW